MIPLYSGVVAFMTVILLGYFTFRRWRELRKNPSNAINKFYFLGAGTMTVGNLFLNIIGFAVHWTGTYAAIFTSLGFIFQIIGFGYFLRIPIYAQLSERVYTFFSAVIHLYSVGTITVFILVPPVAIVFNSIAHWAISPLEGMLLTIITVVAFCLNIYVLYKTMHNVTRAWWPKFFMLIGAFTLTGIGSSYLSLGKNPAFVNYSFVLIFIGMAILIFGTLYGPLQFGREDGKNM